MDDAKARGLYLISVDYDDPKGEATGPLASGNDDVRGGMMTSGIVVMSQANEGSVKLETGPPLSAAAQDRALAQVAVFLLRQIFWLLQGSFVLGDSCRGIQLHEGRARVLRHSAVLMRLSGVRLAL